MRAAWMAVPLAGVVWLGACGAGDSAADCAQGAGLCGDVDGGLLDGDVADRDAPANCDEAADPVGEAARGCVVDAFAVFVDGEGGDDANDGTKATPLKKIASAIAKVASTGKRRIYVCGSATYSEHVKLTTAANLHGGFACKTWSPDPSARPRVAPSDKGYALHVDNVDAVVTVSDLEFVAANARTLKDGTSSIAVFVNRGNVTFLRTAMQALNGAEGGPGQSGTAGVLTAVSSGTLDLNANPSSGATGGLYKDCTCSSSTTTTRGGTGGTMSTGGGRGAPNYGSAPPNNGAAGVAVGGSCENGGIGSRGSSAPTAANAAPPTTLGVLTATGWEPSRGAEAPENGEPGQGGGGGGSAGATVGGGGGGCGGCGGFAGKGSGGGGGSIALLVNESRVKVESAKLETRAGGPGGAAGAGGPGANGGFGGAGACSGGTGGRGADGGAGAGGAGGISIGVLYEGTAPEIDAATTITVGAGGAGGKGGKSPDNDGPGGVAEKTKDAAQF
ncbi:MAG: hypothetical protein KF764_00825 [Labilithrix sp.]|nr:hypothetical protein [Labilithrix sp.]